MRQFKLPRWLLLIAVLIIQLHAALPHCHFETSAVEFSCEGTASKEHSHSHLPCHPDLGEHHLEDITAQKQLFVFFQPPKAALPALPLTTAQNSFVIPLSVAIHNPQRCWYHRHRGPPVIA